MNIKKIKKHIWTLATLPETGDPIVSCYLAVENGRIRNRKAAEKCLSPIKDGLLGQNHQLLRKALKPMQEYLANSLLPDAKGVAIFSHAGSIPFFLPLQFRVSMPYWVAVDLIPNIFHLAELKDNYHRYVILMIADEGAQILEVNISSVTKELWTQRPELRKRISWEWTKTHFQQHPLKTSQRSIKEKVKILKRLISEEGQTKLVLSGDPRRIAEIKNNLPQHLLAKLVEIMPLSCSTEPIDAVKATIGILIREEEKASQISAEFLSQEMKIGGHAVAGMKSCLKNLKKNLVESLIMLETYSPGMGWICNHCGFINFNNSNPDFCLTCKKDTIKKINIKEEMVRLAECIGAAVKIVGKNDDLHRLGGVGCLLRMPHPE
jgi:rubrerythrin